jgi:hypothetical protein
LCQLGSHHLLRVKGIIVLCLINNSENSCKTFKDPFTRDSQKIIYFIFGL